MPKKISKRLPINLQRLSEQRLIDTKIIKARDQNPFSRVVAWAAALGFLVGGGIIGYFWFSGSAVVEPETSRNIVIPEETATAQEHEPTPSPAPTQIQPAQKMVEVLATETGYLNVREGPGTNYKKIREVRPGEAYEYVSEDTVAGWYQIKFEDGSTGWVINKYAKIK